MFCLVSFVCKFIGQVSCPPPPPLHATDNSTFTFYFIKVFFKDTLYFLLKYVLPPVLFTFTQVQIQSNLGTTDQGKKALVLFGLFIWRRVTLQSKLLRKVSYSAMYMLCFGSMRQSCRKYNPIQYSTLLTTPPPQFLTCNDVGDGHVGPLSTKESH